MKLLALLSLLVFSSIVMYNSAQAQCPNPVEEAYEDLHIFLNDNHFQQDRVNVGLANVSEGEIIIMDDNQHASACQAISQEHPVNQTRDVNVYPGPDKITYYQIRDLYVMIKVNRRYFQVDEDEIWVDLVATAIVVYSSDFERIHQNMLK